VAALAMSRQVSTLWTSQQTQQEEYHTKESNKNSTRYYTLL
jgi:hypothetical protein